MVVDSPRPLKDAAWRFVVAGGFNTLVTGLALAVLSNVMPPRVAYTVVFAAGIVLSTVLARQYVYGYRLGVGGSLAYASLYLFVYLLGLVAIGLFDDLGLPRVSSGLVVFITAPLTFMGGRVLTTVLHARSVPSSTNQSIESV